METIVRTSKMVSASSCTKMKRLKKMGQFGRTEDYPKNLKGISLRRSLTKK